MKVPKVAVRELVKEMPVRVNEEGLNNREQLVLVYVGGRRPFQWVHEDILNEDRRDIPKHVVPRVFVDSLALYRDFDYKKGVSRRKQEEVLVEYITNGIGGCIKAKEEGRRF